MQGIWRNLGIFGVNASKKVEIFLVVRKPRQNSSSGPRVGKGWEPLD